MEARAYQSNIGVPATKVRQIIDLIRNKPVEEALNILRFSPKPVSKVIEKTLRSAIANALNRGALGVAAQALGLAQRMIDLSVQYTSERKQFGVAIGSFQAVKHHMANIAYKLEYAKTPVYRAAYDIANKLPRATLSVSHAKLAACEVADLAAKNSIQVHGAMGYTWEVDLHIFMKRAWAFNSSFGTAGFHKQRVAAAILADDAPLGAGATF